MARQPVVALDIGSTKVACAVGLPREDAPGFDLGGSSLVSYPRLSETWSADPDVVGRTIEQAIEATGVAGELQRSSVSFSHPSLGFENVHASVVMGDEPSTIRERDLDRLKQRALDHVLGVDREALAIERLGYSGNGFAGVHDPVGLTAIRLVGDFHIVSIPIAERRAIVQAVESAGMDVDNFTFSLNALACALAADYATQRVLLVDVGGLHTNIGILLDGRVHRAHTVGWGGLKLAMELAKSSHLTLEQATTVSLQGLSSRKPEVKQLFERELRTLQRAIQQVIKGGLLPDATIVSGRGALIDGLVEWIEGITKIKTSVIRGQRTKAVGELARQVGLTEAHGLLEFSTRTSNGKVLPCPSGAVDRLVHRTRTLLTEYF